MFATSMHTYYVIESIFYAQIVDTNNIRSSIAGRVVMVVGDPAIGDEGGRQPRRLSDGRVGESRWRDRAASLLPNLRVSRDRAARH